MLKLIIGIILLLIPFLLSYKFKKEGFIYIFSLLIGFHLFVAILTQSLGVFNYWIILGFNLALGIFVVYKIDFYKFKAWIKNRKIDWIFLIVLVILFIQFFSIHHDYGGEISTPEQSYVDVKNMEYKYPYYSDEWVHLSLMKYTVDSGKIPLVNPLWRDFPFPNMEVTFNSFNAEAVSLLGLEPLTSYIYVGMFFSLVVCFLIYFVLRANNISRAVSAITTLSIPYIISAGNLPGLWYYMPFTLGLLTLLLGIFFMSKKDSKFALYMGILTFVFYPPLALVYTVSYLSYLYSEDFSSKKKMKETFIYIGSLLFLAIIFFILVSITQGSFNQAFSYILSKIFYTSFTPGGLLKLSLLHIIPVWSLIFFAFSYPHINKKIWLFVPVALGLIYWFIYSGVLWRFIIEFQRIVYTTSILIVILSGFGLQSIVNYIKNKQNFDYRRILAYVFIATLIVFLIFSFNYTERDSWKELKLKEIDTGKEYTPRPPANNYLNSEDLRLFRNLSEEKFLSNNWKGLVVGAATNNYPAYTKASVISNNLLHYNKFMESNCSKKRFLAYKVQLDYIYSSPFECDEFYHVGENKKDNLSLYKVNLTQETKEIFHQRLYGDE